MYKKLKPSALRRSHMKSPSGIFRGTGTAPTRSSHSRSAAEQVSDVKFRPFFVTEPEVAGRGLTTASEGGVLLSQRNRLWMSLIRLTEIPLPLALAIFAP